jgi:hypothetical protein
LNIDVFPAKQLLVFAGVFLVIWPLSLVILLKRSIRIGADLLLLIASIVGVTGWTMVGNNLFVIFALTCVAVSALHLFLYAESRILQRDDAPRTPSNSDTMPLQTES